MTLCDKKRREARGTVRSWGQRDLWRPRRPKQKKRDFAVCEQTTKSRFFIAGRRAGLLVLTATQTPGKVQATPFAAFSITAKGAACQGLKRADGKFFGGLWIGSLKAEGPARRAARQHKKSTARPGTGRGERCFFCKKAGRV